MTMTALLRLIAFSCGDNREGCAPLIWKVALWSVPVGAQCAEGNCRYEYSGRSSYSFFLECDDGQASEIL